MLLLLCASKRAEGSATTRNELLLVVRRKAVAAAIPKRSLRLENKDYVGFQMSAFIRNYLGQGKEIVAVVVVICPASYVCIHLSHEFFSLKLIFVTSGWLLTRALKLGRTALTTIDNKVDCSPSS